MGCGSTRRAEQTLCLKAAGRELGLAGATAETKEHSANPCLDVCISVVSTNTMLPKRRTTGKATAGSLGNKGKGDVAAGMTSELLADEPS